jgi:glycosyltransferase involved in cell wall biosynthesis
VKILWSSPLPPVRSGVSDYAVELMDELSSLAELRIAAPQGWLPDDSWILDLTVKLASADARPEAGEINLVHLGNNPHHEWLLDRLVHPRTVVVLHDTVLHHLLVEVTVGGGDTERYAERLAVSHRHAAECLARARRVGVTGRRDPFLFPALGWVLAGRDGVIAHSSWACRQVAREVPGTPCRRIGLAVADPGAVDRDAARTELNVERDPVLVMHLGFLSPDKGLYDILEAIGAASRAGTPVHLVIVGEGDQGRAITAAAESIGIGSHVSLTGWVPGDRMRRLPAAADLGVVLRTPSAGETSAAAVRFLACGTPVAVTGLNQFLEWPEEAAPRVTPGPSTAAELARLIATVARDRTAWETRRWAARAAYEARHQPRDVAGELVNALEELAG